MQNVKLCKIIQGYMLELNQRAFENKYMCCNNILCVQNWKNILMNDQFIIIFIYRIFITYRLFITYICTYLFIFR